VITPTQKQTAQAIINIFETDYVLGDYGDVTVIAGDTGHLTFGRSQTTLATGNLATLVQSYCDNAGARFAVRLRPYLPQLIAKDVALDNDTVLHNILRATADDIVMRDTQDLFFDESYWLPAQSAADGVGLSTPLGVTVVYDSIIQGSWDAMCQRTNTQFGTVAGQGEKAWISAYVGIRRDWLATNANLSLPPTVYRMDAIRRLIDLNLWGLFLPLVVRDKEISTATLNGTPPDCYDGPQPGSRPLATSTPLLKGLDVRLVQLGLSTWGADVKADGLFGGASADGVRKYQSAKGRPITGIADVALIAELVN
jgi:chitosanase